MKRTPLKRKTGLQRGKPLAKRSTKATQIAPKRRKHVREYLELHPECEARIRGICGFWSRDVHERLRRSQGGDILDGGDQLAVCRPCHTWITEHPTDAKALGLARSRWEPPLQRTGDDK